MGKFLSVGEQSCLVFAARYAHTRHTAAACVVVDEIIQKWDKLRPETQDQLKREAKNEAVYNSEDWKRLIDL